MVKQISSLQNPFIKTLVQLNEKSRLRKKQNQFLIEGIREISLAKKGNFKIESLLFDKDIISLEQLNNLFNIPPEQCIEISKNIYDKLAYRNTTEGVLALAQSKIVILDKIVFKNDNPLILVVEAPEKPGNIGALLRTADAAHLDAVLIANPKTDLFNPNIIRSSVGCVFTNQIAMGTTVEIIKFLKSKDISIYCAALHEDSLSYTSQNYQNATAIVVGTEATGLSQEWLSNSNKNIIIPMQGEIDSMNVSVSAGILIFEAKRQRNFSYE